VGAPPHRACAPADSGKNIWRLCKTWRRDGDLRRASQPRAGAWLLGHTRIETTQIYAQIQPAQLKQTVNFYEARALEALSREAKGGSNERD